MSTRTTSSARAGYRRPMSTWWWTKKGTYLLFVLRELSSLFIGWFMVYLLLMFAALSRGAAAYAEFLDWAALPWVVIVNVVALAFAILHTITWFLLTPRAMVINLVGLRVPPWVIIGGQYAALVVASVFVFWLVIHD